MSVRIKFFLCLAGVALVLWNSTAYLATSIFLERFDELDAQQVGRTLNRVREGLHDRERQMMAVVSLWLKEGQKEDFEKSGAEFLGEFDMNMLATVGAEGRVDRLILRRAPGGENRLTITDEAMLADLVESLGRSRKGSGLANTSLGPLLYAVDGDPGKVSTIAGIFIGGEYEKHLRKSLLSEFSILPPSGSVMDFFHGQSAETQLSIVPPVDPEVAQISGYSLMRDAKGNPILILKVSEARHSYLEGTANLRFFLGFSAAIALLAVMCATLLAEVMVTRRLRRLATSVRRAEINNMDDLAPGFFRGKDEVSTLARTTKLIVDRLKNSQFFYRAVVETQKELIVRFKPDGEITLANEAFAKFFGRHLHGIVGKNLKDFLTPESLEGGNILDHLPSEALRSNLRDFKILLNNGQEYWLQWHQRALVDEDHSIVEIQASGYDTTFRRDCEKKLKIAQEATEAANRAKEIFPAVMTQEMRAPLTQILQSIMALEGTVLTAEQKGTLDLLHSSGNNLSLLLDNLLDYSHVAAGIIELHPETVEIEVLMREVVSAHTSAARARQIALHCDIQTEAPSSIQADADRLRQVLNNVVSYGIQCTERGFVRMTVKPGSAGMVDFLIQDTGKGILREEIAGVFDVFQAVGENSLRAHNTARIGLAIAQKLLAYMGGDISIRSESGIGSLFTISLPVCSHQADAVISEESNSVSQSDPSTG